ncbi:ribonuclease H-like domain-containing protein [Tanacetum coccineum]
MGRCLVHSLNFGNVNLLFREDRFTMRHQDPIHEGMSLTVLFDVDTGRVSIRHCESITLNTRFVRFGFSDRRLRSSRKYGLEKYVTYSNLSASNLCFSTTLNKSSEPNTYYDALKDSKWIEAMNNEIEALNRNKTWTIYDLSKSKYDYSLFTKKSDDVFVALLVYVDDIVITENNLSEIEKFKVYLKSKFQIKDLGKLKYFLGHEQPLGIEVLDNKDGNCLSQRKYCFEILYEYGLLAAKHVDTPLPENTTLNHIESDDDTILSDIGNYKKLVGKLIYLTNTRHDISYVVHCLSQFMHAPIESHFDVALRVLGYLKGSLGNWIQINKNGNLKLRIAANPVFHEKSKYFEIDVYLVKAKVASGVIKTKKIYTSHQIADILTKALNIRQHSILCEKLGLLDMFKVEKLEGGWSMQDATTIGDWSRQFNFTWDDVSSAF